MKKRILIVDNNSLLLMGLSRALSNPFVEVVTAEKGEKALEEINSRSFDLCLIDAHLSGFNGSELIERINTSLPNARIILMTTIKTDKGAHTLDTHHSLLKETYGVITKPFSVNDVLSLVGIALKEENGAQLSSASSKAKTADKRNKSRQPFIEDITFFLTVIHAGEERRWSIPAQSLDISDEGIGILTEYPLKESHIIGFDNSLNRKSGVVIWSESQNEQGYRAGIKFA